MAFFEGIAEVLLEFFGDIVFELALKPFLKHTGIVFRWLCWLGTKKYEDLYEKKYNTLLGFVIVVVIIVCICLNV